MFELKSHAEILQHIAEVTLHNGVFASYKSLGANLDSPEKKSLAAKMLLDNKVTPSLLISDLNRSEKLEILMSAIKKATDLLCKNAEIVLNFVLDEMEKIDDKVEVYKKIMKS